MGTGTLIIIIAMFSLWIYLGRKHYRDLKKLENTADEGEGGKSKIHKVDVIFFLAMAVIIAIVYYPSDEPQYAGSTKVVKESSYGVMQGNTWWTPYENLEEYAQAVMNRDAERLAAMANSRKIFKVYRETKVIYSDSGIYSGIIFVTFQDGEYAGKRGYTLSKCVR